MHQPFEYPDESGAQVNFDMYNTMDYITSFVDRFTRNGYSAIYVYQKAAYLKALNGLRKNDLLIYFPMNAETAHIVILSDSEIDTVTFTFDEGILTRRPD